MCSGRDVKFWKEFFSVYKHYPELWKVKSEAYKNRMLKRKAYGLLLEKYREYEPEATVETLKRRINCLRGCYRRELKKLIKSQESGCRDEDLYKPNLWYFNDLNFLRDQEEDETEGNATFEVETTFMDTDGTFNPEDQDPVSINDTNKNDSIQLFDKTRNEKLVRRPSSLQTSKKITTQKTLEDLQLICKQLSQTAEEDDEFTSFGLSVASQLKKLPEKIAQESMDYIQSFLVRQRLKIIDNPNSVSIPNKKRKLSEGLNNCQVLSQAVDETSETTKRLKEKEIEFLELEHNEKVQNLILERKILENKLIYDQEEHALKVQALTESPYKPTSEEY